MSENTPLQLIPPPAYDYYVSPYPILSFLYGLYCDPDWSSAEYDKWSASLVGKPTSAEAALYEYEGFLDPYPHLPHGVRVMFTTRIYKEGNTESAAGDPTKVRFLPNEGLTDSFLPYLLKELTFDPKNAKSPRGKQLAKSIKFDSARPILSGLSLIFLRGLTAPELIGNVTSHADLADLSRVAEDRDASKDLNPSLQGLAPKLIRDLIATPAMW